MGQIDGQLNGIQSGNLNGNGINMGNIGGNLNINIPDINPINLNSSLEFNGVQIEDTPVNTGETQIIEETVTYTEEERKDNAMTMAERTYELSTLRQEYETLLRESNDAIRAKREEIDQLEQEIKAMQEGIVNGEETIKTECEVWETPTQNILIPKGEILLSANIKNVIAKNAQQLADYQLRHSSNIVDDVEVIDDPVEVQEIQDFNEPEEVQTVEEENQVQNIEPDASIDVIEQPQESI